MKHSIDEYRELLSYNPETGEFCWKKKPRRNTRVGDVAGTLSDRGYVWIGCFGSHVYAHRLAWAFYYNEWPEEIDHINRVKGDNRIANLRKATRSENNINVDLRRNNTSGVKGVSWHKRREEWQAYIAVGGHQIRLGWFKNKEDAAIARRLAEQHHHGEFTVIT